MKILMVNKFLYPNGGSETYIFKLGDFLTEQGHKVQYFGMEHDGRIVGNEINAYTSDMDFHTGSKLKKLVYPIKSIYSIEAVVQIRKVLNDFRPDVVHINNFNYQLTPSIIVEIVRWRRKNRKRCKIVYTAHDGQLVCPNHMLYNPNTKRICKKCIGGHFTQCIKNKCIHGSTVKSAVGTAEAFFWKYYGIYKYIDTIICPSQFMKKMLDTNPLLSSKTTVLYNFIDKTKEKNYDKKEYVLYFGGFTEEKGVATLIKVCKELPDIHFVFAGDGPLVNQIDSIPNIKNVGFQSGEDLKRIIGEAMFSICPSELNENCPFSVLESQDLGTPVIGSKVGGIPELIENDKNGRIFRAKDVNSLKHIIKELWNNPQKVDRYREECLRSHRDGIAEYCKKMISIYYGK